MSSFRVKKKLLQKSLKSHVAIIGLLTLSTLIFISNHLFFHYHGNQYIPSVAFGFSLYMLVFYICTYALDILKPCRVYFKDCLSLGSCVLIISLATNAIQFTPFSTIDEHLGRFELLPLTFIISWTKAHAYLFLLLTHFYNSLNIILVMVPLLLIMFQKKTALNSFYRFIMTSTFLGFIIYFFFPSCGPASFFPKNIFEYYQIDNSLKFYQIHHGEFPSTELGGLIAFPSFHVIWAYACVYPLRNYKWIKSVMYLWFSLISLSCIMLGWHYSLDILGSYFIITLSRKIIEQNQLS